ncbi:MAG: carbohydrate ABC transporter permease [Spirochaetota bacterium]|nr:MAG: carbohydrate ABC transporter permease [Spirochaetota bacterium]
MTKSKKIIKSVFTWIVIAIIVVFFFFPIFWEFLTSFKSSQEVISSNQTFRFTPSVESWKTILEKGFLRNLKNTIIIASCSTALAVLIGALAAYALGVNFKRRKMIAFQVIMLRMLPPVSVIVPIFLLWKAVHLTDTFLGLILIYIAFNLPFSCWLLMQYFKGVPQEIRDAALVDGSSWSKTFWRIVLPLAKPGVFAVTIFCFIFSWSEFLFALILSSEKTFTLPVAAAGVLRMHLMDWGALSSACSMIMIIPLIFVFIVQKHFVRGLTFGAMK